MSATPLPGAGPATRAVLEQYHRALATHGRWLSRRQVITIVLIAWTVLSVVVLPVVAFSADLTIPWYLTVGPAPILALWLISRQRVADRLGTRYTPVFPEGLLKIAQATDAAAASPRAFGAIPESMRQYRPENW